LRRDKLRVGTYKKDNSTLIARLCVKCLFITGSLIVFVKIWEQSLAQNWRPLGGNIIVSSFGITIE